MPKSFWLLFRCRLLFLSASWLDENMEINPIPSILQESDRRNDTSTTLPVASVVGIAAITCVHAGRDDKRLAITTTTAKLQVELSKAFLYITFPGIPQNLWADRQQWLRCVSTRYKIDGMDRMLDYCIYSFTKMHSAQKRVWAIRYTESRNWCLRQFQG